MTTSIRIDSSRIISRTPVQLNNSALALFLSGDYGHAIEDLTIAYALWVQRVQQAGGIRCPQRIMNLSNRPTVLPSDYSGGDVEEDIAVADNDPFTRDTPMNHSKDDDSTTDVHAISRPLHESASEQETSDSPTRTAVPSINLSIPCCPVSSSASTAAARNAPSTASGAAFTMYNRALVLARSDDEDKCLARTGAIIIYNLALVHHNLGVHLGVSASLWEALQLYEQALEILDKSMPKQVVCQNPTTTTAQQLQASICGLWRVMNVEKLLLAILNNMGNIHAHLFHKENTNACMKSLRLVLELSTAASSPWDASSVAAAAARQNNHAATSASSRTSPLLSSAVMDEDYVFFLLNSLFQEKVLCFAPAA